MNAKYMGWNFSQMVAGKILKNKLFKLNCFLFLNYFNMLILKIILKK
jgi:hypothetical protein